jgi:hypothetical protein
MERLWGEHQQWREALTQALEELSEGKEALRLALARIEELERQREPQRG